MQIGKLRKFSNLHLTANKMKSNKSNWCCSFHSIFFVDSEKVSCSLFGLLFFAWPSTLIGFLPFLLSCSNGRILTDKRRIVITKLYMENWRKYMRKNEHFWHFHPSALLFYWIIRHKICFMRHMTKCWFDEKRNQDIILFSFVLFHCHLIFGIKSYGKRAKIDENENSAAEKENCNLWSIKLFFFFFICAVTLCFIAWQWGMFNNLKTRLT